MRKIIISIIIVNIAIALFFTFSLTKKELKVNTVESGTNVVKTIEYSREDVEDWYYTYCLAGVELPVNSEETRIKYANAVEKFANKYEIVERRTVSKIVYIESKYKRMRISYFRKVEVSNGVLVTNKIAIAYGPMQVRPKFWGHVPYNLDTNLSRNLRNSKHQTEELLRILQTIRWGIETGCFVFKVYLDKNKGNYPHALTDYNAGQNSDNARDIKRRKISNKYVDWVYNGELERQLDFWFSDRWNFYNTDYSIMEAKYIANH
jgi:hypothetical protein